MNKKTLNSFIAAGNALLCEDFKGGDAAIIMYNFDGAPAQYGERLKESLKKKEEQDENKN